MTDTCDLRNLLHERFPSNAFAVLEEVRDAAGFYAGRSADALVMSLWPSRGLSLQGFELKASRTDWMRELKRPEKAESLFSVCDRWWLLAADEKIAPLAEVPETWGLMVPGGRGLKVVREAPKLEPKPLSRSFLAALLKRAQGSAPSIEQLRKERETGIEEGKVIEKRNRDWTARDNAQLVERVTAFEKASGLSIQHGWALPELGKAVKDYLRNGIPGKETLRRYREQLLKAASEVDVMLTDAGV